MKTLLRNYLICLTSLEAAIFLIPGITNTGGLKTLVIATLVFSLMNFFIRPLISLLLLPINVVTLGAFRWLVNVLVLFLLTLVVTELKISAFTFPGYFYHGFIIPELAISRFWNFVLASACISFVNSFLLWLVSNN